MKPAIAIMIPAIIDQECAEMVSDTIRKNIVNANTYCDFILLLNIDDYCRKGCHGDVDSISKTYNELGVESNCSISIIVHKKPLGLTPASRELFGRFLKTGAEALLFLDDDCEIINPVIFKDFMGLIYNDVTLHLAFAYDDKSSENPFIRNDIYFDGQSMIAFRNSHIFLTENGTIFTKEMVKNILNEYESDKKKYNPKYNPEDVIGHLNCYKQNPVITLAHKDKDCIVRDVPLWKLPKKNHFVVDSVRHYRKVGWNR